MYNAARTALNTSNKAPVASGVKSGIRMRAVGDRNALRAARQTAISAVSGFPPPHASNAIHRRQHQPFAPLARGDRLGVEKGLHLLVRRRADNDLPGERILLQQARQ